MQIEVNNLLVMNVQGPTAQIVAHMEAEEYSLVGAREYVMFVQLPPDGQGNIREEQRVLKELTFSKPGILEIQTEDPIVE